MWRGQGAQLASLALYKTSAQHPLLSPKVVLLNSRSKSIIFGPNSQRVWSAPSKRPNIGQNQLGIETSPRLTPVANWPRADYHYFRINFVTERTVFYLSFHSLYEALRAQAPPDARHCGRPAPLGHSKNVEFVDIEQTYSPLSYSAPPPLSPPSPMQYSAFCPDHHCSRINNAFLTAAYQSSETQRAEHSSTGSGSLPYWRNILAGEESE
ncbi:hypothetical protein E2C01_042427 [Portunus trituberculatus]|uniref:Uncharacterized protein n=1 Tax=Portunus trituberculatus TaxID=210409 RepID=A0A5B7FT16_PORTR|nr:hypothetical protein [Portunus trituberculatus]